MINNADAAADAQEKIKLAAGALLIATVIGVFIAAVLTVDKILPPENKAGDSINAQARTLYLLGLPFLAVFVVATCLLTYFKTQPRHPVQEPLLANNNPNYGASPVAGPRRGGDRNLRMQVPGARV